MDKFRFQQMLISQVEVTLKTLLSEKAETQGSLLVRPSSYILASVLQMSYMTFAKFSAFLSFQRK